MINSKTYEYILESIPDPIVFVDTNHKIKYMNKAAFLKYAKRGGSELVGKSIFDCHNEKSNKIILEIYDSFIKGEDERFLTQNKEGKNVFMRVVRDKEGNVVGYYERYEKA
ncbi:MAG: PAS domain-containing protein [Eubacteriaceae bacterium]